MRLRTGVLVGSVILLAVVAIHGRAEPLSSSASVACSQGVFYVGQSLVLACRPDGRLFKATDTGWHELSQSISGTQLTVAPDGVIYSYSVFTHQTHRSFDGGETWQLMGQFPYAQNQDGVSLSASPISGTVFIGMGTFVSQYRGIFKSIDAGVTWSQVLSTDEAGPVSYSPTFAQDGTAFAPLADYHYSAGIWKTTDWGDTWAPVNNGLYTGGSMSGHLWVAVSPQFPQDQTAFTSDDTGFYKTIDGGQTWFKIANLVLSDPVALSPNYSRDQTLLIGDGDYSLFLSQDGGLSQKEIWSGRVWAWGIRLQGSFGTSTVPPAPPPSAPYQVYLPLVNHNADALEFWAVAPKGQPIQCYLYRSRDYGATWEEVAVFEASHWAYLPVVSH
jgi:hypothetical protein